MSNFQFELPVSNSDLLNTSGNYYYVKHVYSGGELADQLKTCQQILQQNDPFYIFDHFDIYFTVIEGTALSDAAAVTSLMRAFDLLFVTVDKMGTRLSAYFAGTTSDDHGRADYLNLLKMTMYLQVGTVKKIDSMVQKQQQQSQQLQQKKRGKNSATTPFFEQHPHWESKRGKFLVQLYNVMQFPLEKLWSPPVVEENFINMLCDICYRTLEVFQSRPDNQHLCATIFQILGTAIKRYNHALTFPVRILQILRTVERAAITVANGVYLLHEEFAISSIFGILVKDIVEALSLDSADTAVARNFSNFLMEFANIAPKLIIPHLSTLAEELLNCESHMLRNCILQIMGDAIMGELTSEELSDQLKEARNEFLEHLMAHLCDVSAHVRAKVLQIWQHMKEENAVPLSFQCSVLHEAVDRLEDKTATVRKSAVQLIKSFLECNPFAPKLSLADLQKQHEEARQKMDELSQLVEDERKEVEKLNEKWESLAPDILPHIVDHLKQFEEVEAIADKSYEDVVTQVGGLLLDKNYKEAVKLVRQAESISGTAQASAALKPEEQCVYYLALLRSYMFLAHGTKDSNEKLGTQIKTVKFLEDLIDFSKTIMRAVPKLQDFLLSKTISDTVEAVDLFTTGYLFGISGMEQGMQLMLQIVWSSDKEKRDAVSNAYKKTLFDTQETGRVHAVKVIQNLMRFLRTLEYGHYTAFEVLVREWVNTDDIDAIIVQVLFERFTLKLEGTTADESRLALQLLIMASQEKSSIAKANLSIIEGIALGERGRHDPRLFTSCLEFMLNALEGGGTATKYYKRYEADHKIVQDVLQQYRAYFFQPQLPDYDRLAMRVLEFVYHMCQTPDLICQRLLVDLLQLMRTYCLTNAATPHSAVSLETQSSVPDSQPVVAESQAVSTQHADMRMPAYLLARFIYLIGYMTLKELIFLDIDVYNNMKYRQELAETEQQKRHQERNTELQNLQQKPASARRTTMSVNMSATESLKRLSGSAAEPQQEPNEDLVGATAEDNIAELINHICEDVLLFSPEALLAVVFPYIRDICKYPAKYHDDTLQQAATLALVRCMCVSAKVCEKNMPFLMNVLGHTKNTRIKCNIIIGLADLTFRFPNVIEPWTGHFYSTLHTSDNELRLTAVKMLAHLIMHEMIRVKGQIADLAVCLIDPYDEIRHRTQQFFKEIANKSNILYNVLPDIISKLGDISLNLEEEKYRVIMRFILGLIQKDRQVETLVEKLCLRFDVTREERQWRDVAFCLTLLSYNERSLKKLTDHVHGLREKLQIDEVYEAFRFIISSTGKLAKPEIKAALQEFETRLTEARDGKTENRDEQGVEGVETDTQRTKKKTRKGNAGTRERGRRRKPRRGEENSGAEDESEEEATASEDSQGNDFESQPRTTSRKAPGNDATRMNEKTRQRAANNDDSASSGDGDARPRTIQRKRGRRRR